MPEDPLAILEEFGAGDRPSPAPTDADPLAILNEFGGAGAPAAGAEDAAPAPPAPPPRAVGAPDPVEPNPAPTWQETARSRMSNVTKETIDDWYSLEFGPRGHTTADGRDYRPFYVEDLAQRIELKFPGMEKVPDQLLRDYYNAVVVEAAKDVYREDMKRAARTGAKIPRPQIYGIFTDEGDDPIRAKAYMENARKYQHDLVQSALERASNDDGLKLRVMNAFSKGALAIPRGVTTIGRKAIEYVGGPKLEDPIPSFEKTAARVQPEILAVMGQRERDAGLLEDVGVGAVELAPELPFLLPLLRGANKVTKIERLRKAADSSRLAKVALRPSALGFGTFNYAKSGGDPIAFLEGYAFDQMSRVLTKPAEAVIRRAVSGMSSEAKARVAGYLLEKSAHVAGFTGGAQGSRQLGSLVRTGGWHQFSMDELAHDAAFGALLTSAGVPKETAQSLFQRQAGGRAALFDVIRAERAAKAERGEAAKLMERIEAGEFAMPGIEVPLREPAPGDIGRVPKADRGRIQYGERFVPPPTRTPVDPAAVDSALEKARTEVYGVEADPGSMTGIPRKPMPIDEVVQQVQARENQGMGRRVEKPETPQGEAALRDRLFELRTEEISTHGARSPELAREVEGRPEVETEARRLESLSDAELRAEWDANVGRGVYEAHTVQGPTEVVRPPEPGFEPLPPSAPRGPRRGGARPGDQPPDLLAEMGGVDLARQGTEIPSPYAPAAPGRAPGTQRPAQVPGEPAPIGGMMGAGRERAAPPQGPEGLVARVPGTRPGQPPVPEGRTQMMQDLLLQKFGLERLTPKNPAEVSEVPPEFTIGEGPGRLVEDPVSPVTRPDLPTMYFGPGAQARRMVAGDQNRAEAGMITLDPAADIAEAAGGSKSSTLPGFPGQDWMRYIDFTGRMYHKTVRLAQRAFKQAKKGDVSADDAATMGVFAETQKRIHDGTEALLGNMRHAVGDRVQSLFGQGPGVGGPVRQGAGYRASRELQTFDENGVPAWVNIIEGKGGRDLPRHGTPARERTDALMEMFAYGRSLSEAEAGVVFRDVPAGQEGRVVPRMEHPEMTDILRRGEGTADWSLVKEALVKANAKHGVTEAEITRLMNKRYAELRGSGGAVDVVRSAIEFTRAIPEAPYRIARRKGTDINLYESEVFRYAENFMVNRASRLSRMKELPDEMVPEIRAAFERAGYGQHFTDVNNALGGLSVESAWIRPGNVINDSMRALGQFFGLAKTGMLTMRGPPNLIELQQIANEGGMRDFAKGIELLIKKDPSAAKKAFGLKDYSTMLEAKGIETMVDMLSHLGIAYANPRNMGPSTGGFFRQLEASIRRGRERVDRLSMAKPIEDFTELATGMQGVARVLRWGERTGTTWEPRSVGEKARFRADVQTVQKATGWKQEVADRIVRGNGTPEELRSFVQQHVKTQTSANLRSLDLSRMENANWFKSAFHITRWATNNQRKFVREFYYNGKMFADGAARIANGDLSNGAQEMAQGLGRMARVAGGRAVVGAQAYLSMSMISDLLAGRPGDTLDEIMYRFSDPGRAGEFLAQMFTDNTLGGIVGSVHRVFGEGDSAFDAVLPVFVGKEVWDSIVGNGKYKGLEIGDRFERLSKRTLPISKYFEQALAGMQIIDRRPVDVKAVNDAYWRWRFEYDPPAGLDKRDVGEYMAAEKKNHDEFNNRMRRFVEAMNDFESPKKIDRLLREAYEVAGHDWDNVAAYLQSRLYFGKYGLTTRDTPSTANWKQRAMEDARGNMGDEVFEMAKDWDRKLEERIKFIRQLAQTDPNAEVTLGDVGITEEMLGGGR